MIPGAKSLTIRAMRFLFLLAAGVALAGLAGAAGCRSTQDRIYSVGVVNSADQPVMLWLTKDGPPGEAKWLTPSQWLQLSDERTIPTDVPHPGIELAPGMRVDIGPEKGKFDRETEAVLLIYSMPVTLEEMAATPRRTSLMEVVYLSPGQNWIMVRSASPVRAERVSRLEGRPSNAGGAMP
jgi:hypothetical protein